MSPPIVLCLKSQMNQTFTNFECFIQQIASLAPTSS